MTTAAPSGARAATTHAGRSGPVAWMVLPALAMFVVFGVVPLVGVLLLSFTQWDGLGAINPAGLSNWRTVLSDPALPHTIVVTFQIMILSWIVQTPMSLLLGHR